MSKPSRLNRALWAFAYVATGGASFYATMEAMNATPESLMTGFGRLVEKPTAVSSVPLKPIPSASPAKVEFNTEGKGPGFEVGPFDTSATQKSECNLAPDEIQDAKDRQASRLKELQRQNIDPRRDYEYLWNRYDSVKKCPDNLQVLGFDKKQFMASLRQAAIAEMQIDHRDLMSGKRHPEGAIKDILNEAKYAAISDDGVQDVAAGLQAAHLPSEETLKEIWENKIREDLVKRLDVIRSFTGGVGQDRGQARFSLTEIRMALREHPDMAASLGIRADELKQAEDRMDADWEREKQEYELAHPGPK